MVDKNSLTKSSNTEIEAEKKQAVDIAAQEDSVSDDISKIKSFISKLTGKAKEKSKPIAQKAVARVVQAAPIKNQPKGKFGWAKLLFVPVFVIFFVIIVINLVVNVKDGVENGGGCYTYRSDTSDTDIGTLRSAETIPLCHRLSHSAP